MHQPGEIGRVEVGDQVEDRSPSVLADQAGDVVDPGPEQVDTMTGGDEMRNLLATLMVTAVLLTPFSSSAEWCEEQVFVQVFAGSIVV